MTSIQYCVRESDRFAVRWEKEVGGWTSRAYGYCIGTKSTAAISPCGRYVVANTSHAGEAHVSVWDEAGTILFKQTMPRETSIQSLDIISEPLRIAVGLSSVHDYDPRYGGFTDAGLCALGSNGKILWHYPKGEILKLVISSDAHVCAIVNTGDTVVLDGEGNVVARLGTSNHNVFAPRYGRHFALVSYMRQGMSRHGGRATDRELQRVRLVTSTGKLIDSLLVEGFVSDVALDYSGEIVAISYGSRHSSFSDRHGMIKIVRLRKVLGFLPYRSILATRRDVDIAPAAPRCDGSGAYRIRTLYLNQEGFTGLHPFAGIAFLRLSGQVVDVWSDFKLVDTTGPMYEHREVDFSTDLSRALVM